MAAEHQGAFGQDAFGRRAERTARFFGTPQYILGQSIVVIVWIALNAVAIGLQWDPYPFILLNLAFSTQAAYAAPLILLAQTRQAERDKRGSDAFEQHREEIERRHDEMERLAQQRVETLRQMLDSNTALTRQDKELTEQVAELTKQIHALLTAR